MTRSTQEAQAARLIRSAAAIDVPVSRVAPPPDDAEIRRWVEGALPRERIDELAEQALDDPSLMRRWHAASRQITRARQGRFGVLVRTLRRAIVRLPSPLMLSSPVVAALAVAGVAVALFVTVPERSTVLGVSGWERGGELKAAVEMPVPDDRAERLALLTGIRSAAHPGAGTEEASEDRLVEQHCDPNDTGCPERRSALRATGQLAARVDIGCRTGIGVAGTDTDQAARLLEVLVPSPAAATATSPLRRWVASSDDLVRCAAAADLIDRARAAHDGAPR